MAFWKEQPVKALAADQTQRGSGGRREGWRMDAERGVDVIH